MVGSPLIAHFLVMCFMSVEIFSVSQKTFNIEYWTTFEHDSIHKQKTTKRKVSFAVDGDNLFSGKYFFFARTQFISQPMTRSDVQIHTRTHIEQSCKQTLKVDLQDAPYRIGNCPGSSWGFTSKSL